jgi:hypothetical protein
MLVSFVVIFISCPLFLACPFLYFHALPFPFLSFPFAFCSFPLFSFSFVLFIFISFPCSLHCLSFLFYILFLPCLLVVYFTCIALLAPFPFTPLPVLFIVLLFQVLCYALYLYSFPFIEFVSISLSFPLFFPCVCLAFPFSLPYVSPSLSCPSFSFPSLFLYCHFIYVHVLSFLCPFSLSLSCHCLSFNVFSFSCPSPSLPCLSLPFFAL